MEFDEWFNKIILPRLEIHVPGISKEGELFSGYKQGLREAWDASRANQWASVEDRLPEYIAGYWQSKPVLVTEDFNEYEVSWYASGKWVIHDTFNITHWMPIPPVE